MKKQLLRVIIPMVLVLTMVSCTSESIEEETAAATTEAVVDTATVASTTDTEIVQSYEYQDNENELAKLINDHRESIGLNRLLLVNHISYKSEEHNEYMIENKVVNHDFFEERAQDLIQVLGAVTVNENIAYNFSTPSSVLNAWLGSDAHKLNIEGDFTHFGISIRVDAETGKKYYTNMFIKI